MAAMEAATMGTLITPYQYITGTAASGSERLRIRRSGDSASTHRRARRRMLRLPDPCSNRAKRMAVCAASPTQ